MQEAIICGGIAYCLGYVNKLFEMRRDFVLHVTILSFVLGCRMEFFNSDFLPLLCTYSMLKLVSLRVKIAI